MNSVRFRFYEELNDFLPEKKRKVFFEHHFIDTTSVKDVIESVGIPHTEVDLILINGRSVGFDYLINNGDEISIYPVFESLDITEVQHLRAKPLRNPKFVADVHLGKLSRYLRMLGIDVIYHNNLRDNQIVIISIDEHRTILTRDLGILKRKDVSHGYFVRNTNFKKQIFEVLKRFDLKNEVKEFTRCIGCNDLLADVKKDTILNQLPPKVAASKNEFSVCHSCNKIYWKGTHYQRMLSFIKTVKQFEF